MSLDPKDRFYQEIFDKQIYKPVLKQKCDVVLDIGALAGEFSIWICYKTKQIYAIEPESSQFAELEKNIKYFSKIKAFKLALSNKNDIGHIQLSGGRGGQSLGEDNENSEEVETKTLATFMKDNNINYVDVLKIDIEGGEKAVFRSEDFKEVADKIKYIIGEHLHEVNDELIKLGFKYEHYDNGDIFKR